MMVACSFERARCRGAFHIVSVCALLAACSSAPTSSLFDPAGGTGGASLTSGGSISGGGSVSLGGAPAFGGTRANGGELATAGNDGGAATLGHGGSGTIGDAAAGGSSSSAGSLSAGGAGAASGGVSATGGVDVGGFTASGGASSGGALGVGGSVGGTDVGAGGANGLSGGVGGSDSAGGDSSGGSANGGVGGCAANASETCDGVDNNCNSMIDEQACPAKCTGFVAAGQSFMACGNPVNATNAESACEAQGMRLAWLDSDAKVNAVTQILKDRAKSPALTVAELYIGATDVEQEGHWHWIGGEHFWLGAANGSPVGDSYDNWAKGRPNNYPATPGEDCAVTIVDYPSDGEAGQWNDVECTELHGVLCERP